MKKFEFSFENLPQISIDAICIGKFDGMHIGHQHIVNYTKNISQSFGLLTFLPTPFIFFKKGLQTIYTNQEKIMLMKSLQIPNFLQINFDDNFAKKTGEEFIFGISQITKNIVVGSGFRFGEGQSCDESKLLAWQSKYNYNAHILPNISQNFESKISSGMLRECIKNGDFTQYNAISNFPFFAVAKVAKGLNLASKIGFSTANCTISQEKLMPPFGVYATQISFDGKTHKSISNYGIKPTIQNSNAPILETHIFNYNENLYDKEVKVEFFTKIRGEQKFSNINQLQFQISQDIQICKKIHDL